MTLGERLDPVAADDPLPWERLAEMDAVYFTAGDAGALRAARAARVLVATPRALDALGHGVELDALVMSAGDAVEQRSRRARAPRRSRGRCQPRVGAVGPTASATAARAAGRRRRSPATVADSYGCGDSFAAGLTFALGSGFAAA